MPKITETRSQTVERMAAAIVATERAKRSTELAATRAAADAAIALQPTPGYSVGKSHGPSDVRKWIHLIAGHKLDAKRAAVTAQRRGQSPLLQRALNETIMGEGGAFVPEALASGFIEELYPNSVFLKAGPRRDNTPHGNKKYMKQAGKSTVSYAGELAPIPASQPGTSEISMILRKAVAAVVMGNEWESDTVIGASFVVDDLLAQTAAFLDKECIAGDGSGGAVRGLVNLVNAGSVVAGSVVSGATFTVANVTKDLHAMKLALKKAKDNEPIKPVWLMNYECENKLSTLVGTGDHITPIAMQIASGKLLGYPVLTSSNVPGGADNTKARLLLVDMNDIVYLEGSGQLGPQIARSTEATIGGVELFRQDAQAIRMTTRFDVMARYEGKEIATMASWLSSTNS